MMDSQDSTPRVRERRPRMRAANALGAAVALCGLLAMPTGVLAADHLSVSVTAGYSGYARGGGWAPVVVTVQNTGPDFRGTLEVNGGPGQNPYGGFGGGGGGAPPVPASVSGLVAAGGGAPHRQTVVVPGGSTKRFVVWVITNANPRASLLSGSGGEVASAQGKTVTLVPDGEILVGVVSDRPEELDDLSSVPLGNLPSPKVSHLRPADLPDSAVGLRGFDALLFDDATTDSLSAQQKTAIVDYVGNGGGLILVAGTSSRRTLAGIPIELLPGTVSGTRTVADLPALAHLTGATSGPGSAEVASLSPAPGARSFRDSAEPVMIQRQVGSGRVLLTAFDPAADPLGSWPGKKDLMRQMLGRVAVTPVAAVQGKGASGFGGPGMLNGVLGNVPALDLPSTPLVGVLLLVYVLAVGPLNYIVLRRLRRRELAWISVPVVVLLFSTVAYAQGVSTRGSTLLANRVNVIRVEPGINHGYVVSYTGIVAPHRGTYTVDAGARPFQSALLDLSGSGAPEFGSTIVEAGSASHVRLEGMNAYSMRGFTDEDFRALPAGGLGVEVRTSGGHLAGRLTNGTGTILSDVATVYQETINRLGTLQPGAAVSIDLSMRPNNSPSGKDIADALFPGGNSSGSTRSDRDRMVRQEIIRTVFPPSPFGVSEPSLVAWMSDSGDRVKINGESAQTHSMTVLIVPLSASEGTPKVAVATGDVAARLVDASGPVSFFGPSIGTSLATGGTLTFEMDLPGSSWQSVSVDLAQTGPFFGPGPPPCGASIPGQPVSPNGPQPPACGDPPTTEAFNFGTGSWTAVSVSSGERPSVVLDPASGVVSPDGTILLRLSNTRPGSTANTGGLSVTATPAGGSR